jgi:hypothetical protein
METEPLWRTVLPAVLPDPTGTGGINPLVLTSLGFTALPFSSTWLIEPALINTGTPRFP